MAFRTDFREIIAACERRFETTRPERAVKTEEIRKLGKGKPVDWRKLDTPERFANRMELLGMPEVAVTLRTGKAPTVNPLEAIVASNDLTGIAFFERGLGVARAVARIEIRDSGVLAGYGTGFLISPDLLMTNNHVLPSESTAAQSVAQFDYLVGCSGRVYEPLVVALDPRRFFLTDRDRDYTIVAVGRGRAGERGWLPLIRGSGKATTGEKVNILQHPGGERLQIVVRDNTIVNVPEGGFFMQYVADTRPGSSGSPVLNDQWELAALHHAGVPRRDKNGRILLRDGSVWSGGAGDEAQIDWQANEGTRISSIVAHVDELDLTSERRQLWEACFAACPSRDLWPFFSEPECEPPRPQPPETCDGNMRREADGTVSWLFKLNFGPVGAPSPAPPRSQVQRPASAAPPPRPMPLAGGGIPSGELRAAAQALVEEFHWDDPYFDAEADAQDRDDYYNGISWTLAPRQLFDALHDLVHDTHSSPRTYNKARLEFLYPAVDLHEDGKLQHIYSGGSFDPVEAVMSELALVAERGRVSESMLTPHRLETLLERDDLWDALDEAGGAPFNCEHVVPQSWFDRDEPMRGDLHHLFTCESRCNSFRGNIPYWQFAPDTEAVMQACGRKEGDKFEPKAGKGAVARATLYFLVRYPKIIGDGSRELKRARLRTLLDWHVNIPVSLYEKHRNRVIQRAQGNRNPFVDHPDAASEALLRLGFAD